MGLCGGLRIWIPNYFKIVRPLIELYHKGAEFIWDERRQAAFDEIKRFVTTAPALQPIDYTIDNPVILAVDSSTEAGGMILYQMADDGKTQHPARFGSIPMSLYCRYGASLHVVTDNRPEVTEAFDRLLK